MSWIGVDLDGTLAVHESGSFRMDHIGAPIPKMVGRVRDWLRKGIDVRIFTARMSGRKEDVQAFRQAMDIWCTEQFGHPLPVTNVKDFSMWQLWDDRAIQVIPNTGERADGEA